MSHWPRSASITLKCQKKSSTDLRGHRPRALHNKKVVCPLTGRQSLSLAHIGHWKMTFVIVFRHQFKLCAYWKQYLLTLGDIDKGLHISIFVCAQWQDTSVMAYTHHMLHVLISLVTSVVACARYKSPYFGLAHMSNDVYKNQSTLIMACTHQQFDTCHGLHALANNKDINTGLHASGVACAYNELTPAIVRRHLPRHAWIKHGVCA